MLTSWTWPSHSLGICENYFFFFFFICVLLWEELLLCVSDFSVIILLLDWWNVRDRMLSLILFFFSYSYCRSNHDFLGITLFICNLIKLVITKNKNPKLNLVRCLCWLLCRLDHASTSLPFFFFFFPFDYNLKWCLIFSIFLGVGLMVCGVFLDVSSFRIMPDFCLWGYA